MRKKTDGWTEGNSHPPFCKVTGQKAENTEKKTDSADFLFYFSHHIIH